MATAREYGPLVTDNDPMSDVPTSLVGLIRNWSNRDAAALPDAIIMDSIRYAVDKAYRHLRIPPLEHSVTYTAADLEAASLGENNVYQSVTALAIPPDLIEFIQIRGVDEDGLTTRVFNEKSDIRSYWDLNQRHTNQTAFWSRQQDQVLLTPAFGQVAVGYYGGFNSPETSIEMYYYRRLPSLNARFNVSPANANRAAFGTAVAGVQSNGFLRFPRDGETGQPLWLDTANDIYYATEQEVPIPTDAFEEFFIGEPVPNWFKDENERIALYGALAECFAYLQEDDQAGKYTQLMMKEIEELNEEDRIRDSSGGNVQVQYNARGLI